jgi:hypothetical protein
MREFDACVSQLPRVWFYARFVDDIIIITSPIADKSSFIADVSSALPEGLIFNHKSMVAEFHAFKSGNKQPALEDEFNFLGYKFSVSTAHKSSGNTITRAVDVDISDRKINNIKTRLAKSAIRFNIDGNYPDLRDRIRLLTGNFNFYDFDSGAKRSSGIFFNYPLVDADTSKALPALDAYLKNLITSTHPRNRLRPTLPPSHRRELARLTFSDGFKKKRFFDFSAARLKHLRACWAYA